MDTRRGTEEQMDTKMDTVKAALSDDEILFTYGDAQSIRGLLESCDNASNAALEKAAKVCDRIASEQGECAQVADLIAMLRDNEREFARHGIARPFGPFSDPREVFTSGLPVDREPTPAELNARDAARYRWLRKHWKGRVAFDAIDSPEQFDEAVDAAKAEFGRALRARKT